MTTQAEEDLITKALAALNLPPPAATPARSAAPPAPAGQAPLAAREPHPAAEPAASPTLHGLEATRRPKASTVCETCLNSVWFTSPAEVKCYCRVMFLVTWSTKEPHQLTACDGVFLGQQE